MNTREVYSYYGREDVQQALLRVSGKREVVAVFQDGGFSTRPNTLVYPKDILMQVMSGAQAFHGSLERWSNPMAVGSDNYERTRIGWDLVLDVDCERTEHGIVAVSVFVNGLRKHGIKNVFLKFTGGTGFHIGVPFEAFPDVVDYRPTREQYPELARKIVEYLKNFVRPDLERAVLKRWSVEELAEQTGSKVGEILTDDGIDPFKVANVDPILISPRHLFRLPFSLHEKTHLVSMPLDIDSLQEFQKSDASPENLKVKGGWFDRFEKNEASMLVVEAVDWWAKQKARERGKARRTYTLRSAVPINFAPPCIQNIIKGLSDGKKRSLFILINYLSSLRWGWEDISEFLVKWNEKNKPPMREGYIRGQVRWHRNKAKSTPPPNCSSPGYYADFGVCKPDSLCGGEGKTIKNPINYAIRKLSKK